jgi:hypothetical protein
MTDTPSGGSADSASTSTPDSLDRVAQSAMRHRAAVIAAAVSVAGMMGLAYLFFYLGAYGVRFDEIQPDLTVLVASTVALAPIAPLVTLVGVALALTFIGRRQALSYRGIALLFYVSIILGALTVYFYIENPPRFLPVWELAPVVHVLAMAVVAFTAFRTVGGLPGYITTWNGRIRLGSDSHDPSRFAAPGRLLEFAYLFALGLLVASSGFVLSVLGMLPPGYALPFYALTIGMWLALWLVQGRATDKTRIAGVSLILLVYLLLLAATYGHTHGTSRIADPRDGDRVIVTLTTPIPGTSMLGTADAWVMANVQVIYRDSQNLVLATRDQGDDRTWIVPTSVVVALQKGAREIVVAQDGSGDYHSIGEAVEAAFDEDTITVRPGVYQERVTVSKDVRISGGMGGDVTIQVATSKDDADAVGDDARYAFALTQSHASLEHITFEGPGSRVLITGGDPSLSYLHFSSSGPDRGNAEGSAAGSGLVITGGSRARIEHCTFTRTSTYVENASPVLRSNRFTDGGIFLHGAGDATIEGNQLANAAVGIAIRPLRDEGMETSGVPTIVENRVVDGGTGIRVDSEATASVVGNVLCGNDTGIMVETPVRSVTVLRNRVACGTDGLVLTGSEHLPAVSDNEVCFNDRNVSGALSADVLADNAVCIQGEAIGAILSQVGGLPDGLLNPCDIESYCDLTR